MNIDLLITNGLVIDGTGLPRRRADVAIRDGRIAEVREHLDTHYAQRILFDPVGQSSPLDG